ncbi:uncharacterized protein LOC135827216 [Sycon ciliatum]|uniref:uncharacterized protein LOC135827216 n=1 Tax=Sycon ciliatum TaxID=27933 RepID=UPI0031F6E5E0
MTTLIGSLEPLNVSSGEWPSYSSCLEHYLTANKIVDDDLKKATMLNVIGGPAFDLLRDLLAPDEPDSKYEELKDVLKDHLAPKPLVIGERYRFYQRNQRQGESIVSSVAELRRLARTCEFKAHLPEALRDRFVCGLRGAGVRRKLLATDSLTFDKAVSVTKAQELAAKDAVEVSAEPNAVAEGTSVHKVTMSSLFADKHKLRPSSVKFRTYTGEKLDSKGVFTVQATINQQTASAELHVVDGPGPVLLGRDWLQQWTLDWAAIKMVQAQNKPTVMEAVKELQTKYAEVFGDDQGCLKATTAQLTLQPDAKPKFLRARQLPLSLKAQVGAKIRRMEAAGIVSRVDWSDWATPVVPVPKPNGTVRLCGDFKVTVNPQL